MDKALYLIPVTLGETEINQVLPSYNHDVIVSIKHFIVENIRSARRFLKKVEKSIDIDELTFYELNRHTDRKVIGEYLEPLKKGLSEPTSYSDSSSQLNMSSLPSQKLIKPSSSFNDGTYQLSPRL